MKSNVRHNVIFLEPCKHITVSIFIDIAYRILHKYVTNEFTRNTNFRIMQRRKGQGLAQRELNIRWISFFCWMQELCKEMCKLLCFMLRCLHGNSSQKYVLLGYYVCYAIVELDCGRVCVVPDHLERLTEKNIMR